MSTPPEWATRSGDAWSGRWREIDLALSDLAATSEPGDRRCSATASRFVRSMSAAEPGSTSMALAASAARRARSPLAICRPRLCGSPRSGSRAASSGAARRCRSGRGRRRTVRPDLLASRGDVLCRPGAGIPQLADCGECRCFAGLLLLPGLGREPLGFRACLRGGRAQRCRLPAASPAGSPLPSRDYVQEILSGAGWTDVEWRSVPFALCRRGRRCGGRCRPCLSLARSVLRPRVVSELPGRKRNATRCSGCGGVIERHFDGDDGRVRGGRMDLFGQGRWGSDA